MTRLEEGWLRSTDAQGVAGGTPLDWAEEAHTLARKVWNDVPPTRVLDDSYYLNVLPIVDRQLSLAGVRLARFLNEALAERSCKPG